MSAIASPVLASDAKHVARDFVDVLRDVCERIVVAGSLRRRKPYVKDVEIVFVPKFASSSPEAVQIRHDFFIAPPKPPPINLAERTIVALLDARLIAPRPNVNGIDAWGPKNKLAIHVPSGMRVDLFTATPENFWNYLVCRTGGERNNIEICEAANRKGWKWNPYGSGFTSLTTIAKHLVAAERDVFDFVGIPYREPWERS
jgi:DNA polymerase/3'-5' exonuclease PolX